MSDSRVANNSFDSSIIMDDVFAMAEAEWRANFNSRRVVMDGDYSIHSREAESFLLKAAEMAGEMMLPIHVQNSREFTVHIIFP